MTTPNLLLVAGITAVIIVSQFSVRPVRPLTYLWVALLIARGCVPPGPARMTVAGIAILVVGLLVSVVFGVLRGRTMPMWRDASGRLYRRGGLVTLLLWITTLATRLGLGVFAVLVLDEPFNGNALWLGIGVTFGVQQLVMTYRGRGLRRPRDERPVPARS
ncbi:hypothetical protein GCM10027176_33850 [Actinoallomurus bryophytorum]|uniref:DUF1453 domain-containing protein n=1 Tax=Actinoallomurus bryophytorum TaxID=1490222 RepID=A0A543CMV6_9ACTN|nr:hypothetical protein [Actinoallomurus bryophytorum]TQL98419.1 hypothetical protein FB559_4042 [Actinoallomurus bryophytorum]